LTLQNQKYAIITCTTPSRITALKSSVNWLTWNSNTAFDFCSISKLFGWSTHHMLHIQSTPFQDWLNHSTFQFK